MKVLKKLMVPVLVLAMAAGLFPVQGAQAATKPDKPAITVKANDDGKSATITIAKTANAEGYKIMVLKPGAKKYVKLATVKKDGTAERTYTAKKLAEGEYKFKVRAYVKSGKKTVWGKYSKVVKVTVGKSGSDDEKKDEDKGGLSDINDIVYGPVTLDRFVGSYEFSDTPYKYGFYNGPRGTFDFVKTDKGYAITNLITYEEPEKGVYEEVIYGKDIEITGKDVVHPREGEALGYAEIEWQLEYDKNDIYIKFADYKSYTTINNLDPEIWGDSILIVLSTHKTGQWGYKRIK